MKPGEEEETFAMVDRGFKAFVRDDFMPEGVTEFYRAIRDMVFNHPAGHFILVAVSQDRIVGMIDMKESCHVSIFFVEPSEMGHGIGRGLMDHAVSLCQREKPDVKEIEVHSSPWAVPVYSKLGFSVVGPEQQKCGIRFTRMIKKLQHQSG
jgi:predicted GNAT family N-acyltransferase